MLEDRVEWKYCPQCGIMMTICPACGMNQCSGGRGKTEDGEDCPICPHVHQVMKEAYENDEVPDFPDNKEEIDRKHQEWWDRFLAVR